MSNTQSRKLPDRQVCDRYQVVSRTLARWDANPQLKFPRPILINGRKYRDETLLNEWDRIMADKARAAGTAAA